jgi:hypothetical protein
MVCTEIIWFRIGTSELLLWTRLWTFGFYKMFGSSSVAAQLAVFQEGLSSRELIGHGIKPTWGKNRASWLEKLEEKQNLENQGIVGSIILKLVAYKYIYHMVNEPPLWSSGQSSWLQFRRSWVLFPALPDFLRSRGSGTGSTQPREDTWGATWMKKQRIRSTKP